MDVYCGTFPSHKSKTVSIHKIQGTAGKRIIKNEIRKKKTVTKKSKIQNKYK